MAKTKDAKTSAADFVPGARAFNKDLAPSAIDNACITNGFAPPPGSPLGEGVGAGFSYCELNCGSAVTATLLAASNPLGDFHAIDTRGPLIEKARILAKDGGARNITFHQSSVEAALEKTLPQFDYIVLDGVYTWVPLRERALLLAFVRKFLRPGGAVFVSYNARPGWNHFDPFRRIFREATRGLRADLGQRLKAAREIYAQLHDAKAEPIVSTHVTAETLEELDRIPADAFAADYANEFADPLYVTEVMSDFGAVDCALAGSVDMSLSAVMLSAHEPFKSVLEKLPTAGGRELAKDMLLDTRYRRDVFVRGGKRLAADNHDMVMNGLAFALEQPPEAVRYRGKLAFGEMRFDNEHVRALVAALRGGPRTLGELIEHAHAQSTDAQATVANVHALLLTGQIRPVYRATRETMEGARRMQKAVRARATTQDGIGFLPSAFGTSFAVPVADQVLMDLPDKTGADAMAEAAFALLSAGGTLIPSARADIQRRARAFRRSAQYYANLGVLAEG
jgi:SAM-dependent methyltransferase